MRLTRSVARPPNRQQTADVGHFAHGDTGHALHVGTTARIEVTAQSRDFTYAANVVQANLLACKSDRPIGQAELTGKTITARLRSAARGRRETSDGGD